MAASVLHKAWVQSFVKHVPLKRRASGSSAYYVLVPEVPVDTAQHNSLLRMEMLPDFEAITPSAAVSGCAKLSIEYDIALEKHCQRLKDADVERSFDDIFVPIEKVLTPLNYASGIARHLSLVKAKDYLEAYKRIHSQVETAKKEMFCNQTLYDAIKQLKSTDNNLTAFQKALLSIYLLEGRMSGLELPSHVKKEKFAAAMKNLSSETNHFRYKAGQSASLFRHTVVDRTNVDEFPPNILQLVADDKAYPTKGPWHLTLNPTIYAATLEYCSNREIRWNVWQAYNNRGSTRHSAVHLNNNLTIGLIRQHRKDAAEILGYSSYAEMCMESKMAGNIENVLNMIESLRQYFQPKAGDELASLQKFAASNGLTDELQPWDVQYYRRQQSDDLYGSSQDFENYFPFPNVLDALFEMCKKLFNITITKVTSAVVSTWHPSVDVFEVLNERGTQMGFFYLDPYARYDQKYDAAWMNSFRERSHVFSLPALSALSLNINPPLGKRPALMSPSDIASLFYQFGHGLQHMLSQVPYGEAYGQHGAGSDALSICGKVLSGLAFRKDWLKRISCHWENRGQLNDSDVEKIINARKHLHAVDMCEQLYLSAYDMEMHTSNTHWNTAMKKLWPQYMVLPLNGLDNHPCSLLSVFADGRQAASAYSYTWSEVVTADILQVFNSASDDNSRTTVGNRFRDTFLYHGGGASATTAFRTFCGHDPVVNNYTKLIETRP